MTNDERRRPSILVPVFRSSFIFHRSSFASVLPFQGLRRRISSDTVFLKYQALQSKNRSALDRASGRLPLARRARRRPIQGRLCLGPGIDQNLNGQGRLFHARRRATTCTPAAIFILVCTSQPARAGQVPSSSYLGHGRRPARGPCRRSVLFIRMMLIAEPERSQGTVGPLVAGEVIHSSVDGSPQVARNGS